jgi:hypothetical protein
MLGGQTECLAGLQLVQRSRDRNMALETLVHGGVVIVFGALIILARDRFALSMMEQLRGFKKELATEGLRRFWARGMAIFGAVVIIIGITIAIGITIIG